MGAWSKDSKSHVVAHDAGRLLRQRAVGRGLHDGQAPDRVHRRLRQDDRLKDSIAVTEGDVIAASVMNRRALTEFFAKEIADAKAKGVLLSLHLKATMMKVSDPIMFGHAVAAYYKDVFDKHAATFDDARRRSRQRHRRRLRQDPEAAGRSACGHRGRHSGRLRVTAAAGDGRFEQGNHQSARAERRDHRRLDAGGDPRRPVRCGARTASCTT